MQNAMLRLATTKLVLLVPFTPNLQDPEDPSDMVYLRTQGLRYTNAFTYTKVGHPGNVPASADAFAVCIISLPSVAAFAHQCLETASELQGC